MRWKAVVNNVVRPPPPETPGICGVWGQSGAGARRRGAAWVKGRVEFLTGVVPSSRNDPGRAMARKRRLSRAGLMPAAAGKQDTGGQAASGTRIGQHARQGAGVVWQSLAARPLPHGRGLASAKSADKPPLPRSRLVRRGGGRKEKNLRRKMKIVVRAGWGCANR
jgi:hypothetical protein